MIRTAKDGKVKNEDLIFSPVDQYIEEKYNSTQDGGKEANKKAANSASDEKSEKSLDS